MKKTKKLIPILVVIFILSIYFIGKNVRFENGILRLGQQAGNVDDIADPGLRKCIKEIQNSDLSSITNLNCSNRNIRSLEGIDILSGLKELRINDNYIEDLSPLNSISTLEHIHANNNMIRSFALPNISNLIEIQVNDNYISNIEDITISDTVSSFHIAGNKLSGDIDLSDLKKLRWINFSNNAITSIKLGTILNEEHNEKIYVYMSNTKLKSVDDIIYDGVPLSTATDTTLKNKIGIFNVANIPWNSKYKKVLVNNSSSLMSIVLSSTGFNDQTLFTSGFENLNYIALSGNDVHGFDFSNLFSSLEDKEENGQVKPYSATFQCDNCSYNNPSEVIVNKEKVKELYIQNNKLSTFDTSDYDNLEAINFSGNQLTNSTVIDGDKLKTIEISHMDYNDPDGTFLSTIKSPANIKSLKLRNIKITGDDRGVLDLQAFTNLEELYLDNCIQYVPNNIEKINVTGLTHLRTIDMSGNANFQDIIFADNGLDNLQTLSLNFTAVNNLDLTKYPNLQKLSVVGAENLTELTNLDHANNRITYLGIALSGLGSDYGIPSSDLLDTLIVNNDVPRTLNLASFPNLSRIVAVSDGEKVILSSSNNTPISNVHSLTPNNINDLEYDKIYAYFTDVSYRKIGYIQNGAERIRYTPKYAQITDLNNFAGTTGYEGYYKVTIKKINSDNFTFDDENKIIFVGQATNDEILDGINFGNDNSLSASISAGKLVVKYNNQEIGSYTISRVAPEDAVVPDDNYEETETIDDEGEKKSLDPVEDKKDYGTTDNPKTGTILSFIALVLLIAAGIVGNYYIRYKKKNEELIQKI